MGKWLPDLRSVRIPAAMQPIMTFLQMGSGKISVLGAVAGAGLDILSASRAERAFLDEIGAEYKPELAENAGRARNQVNEEYYQLAFKENPVLQQAREAAKMDTMIRLANTTIATGVGVLAGLSMSSISHSSHLKKGESNKKQDPSNIVAGVSSTGGALMAGKLMRRVMHTRNLDKAMEKTAHYQIMQIKNKQLNNEKTTPGDIFQVHLMLDPATDKAIAEAEGKRFSDMEPDEQMRVMKENFPEFMEKTTHIAQRINDGERPHILVFGLDRAAAPEQSRVEGQAKKQAVPPMEPMPVEASNAREASREAAKQIKPEMVIPSSVAQQEPQPSEKLMPASHVQRFAPDGARKADFVDRAASREQEVAMQR